MLHSLGAFIFVLGVLIFVHEFGHFVAAKAAGISVPRFSIGMGPATPLSFKWGETEYRIAWLPFGGYVKMASKEEQEVMGAVEGGELEEEYPPERMFEHKSLAWRIVVISAGVVMNALFAWFTYACIGAFYGEYVTPTTAIAAVDSSSIPEPARGLINIPPGTQITRINGDTIEHWENVVDKIQDPTSDRLRFEFAGDVDPVSVEIPGLDVDGRIGLARAIIFRRVPRVGDVTPGEPAEVAGIEAGDVFLRIEGDSVRSWSDMVATISARAGDSLQVSLLRGDSVLTVTVVPEERSVQDPSTGEVVRAGRIGIGLNRATMKHGLGSAIVWGAGEAWNGMKLVGWTLKGLLTGQVSPREIGGPILIGQVSGQVARQGFRPTLEFMAFLSINLAILNLLPIPVLDGGHLVLLLLEGVRGKPVSLALRIRLTQAGLIILVAIMVWAVANDLVRWVTS